MYRLDKRNGRGQGDGESERSSGMAEDVCGVLMARHPEQLSVPTTEWTVSGFYIPKVCYSGAQRSVL